MPHLEEIAKLEAGKNVRPPKKWWDKIIKIVKNNSKYKKLSASRIRQIAGGIWSKYSPTIKEKIIRKLM